MTCLYPIRLDMKKIAKPENRAILPPYVDVPCGRCIKCLLAKQYEWEFRCYCEMVSRGSIGTFLTLTYDDEHNPKRVSKRDVQLFLKRLYKRYANSDCVNSSLFHDSKKSCGFLRPFTYFLSSEYGEESMRPHYHICIFGLDLYDDVTPCGLRSAKGFMATLDDWKYGNCFVAPLTTQNIKYTMKYLLKANLKCGKYKSYNAMLDSCGFEPLFTLKSKGLGSDYFYDHLAEIQEKGGLYVNGALHQLPPYWRKKLDVGGIVFGSTEYNKLRRFQHLIAESEKSICSSDRENKLYEELLYEKKPF